LVLTGASIQKGERLAARLAAWQALVAFCCLSPSKTLPERTYWEVTNQKRALISFCNSKVSPPLHKDDPTFFNGVWKKISTIHTQKIKRDISSWTELRIQERRSWLGAISRHKTCFVVNRYTIDILVTVQILQHWTLSCNVSC